MEILVTFLVVGVKFRPLSRTFGSISGLGEGCSGFWRGDFAAWEYASFIPDAPDVGEFDLLTLALGWSVNRLYINNVNRDCFAKNSLVGPSVLFGLIWVGKNLLDSAVEISQSLGFQFSTKT